MTKFKKEKRITRLIFWPFEELDIQAITLDDKYTLKVTTFEGKIYSLIFRKRISYSDVNEFTIYKIIEHHNPKSNGEKG